MSDVPVISEANAFAAMGKGTTPEMTQEFKECQAQFLEALMAHDPNGADVAFGAFLFWRALQLTAKEAEGQGAKPAMREVSVAVPRISFEALKEAVIARSASGAELIELARQAQPDAMAAMLGSMDRACKAAKSPGASAGAKRRSKAQGNELIGFCLAIVAQAIQLKRGFAK